MKRPKGRPKNPPGTVRAIMQLPRDWLDRIDAVMGLERRRGKFFRSAVERELQRLEAIQAKAEREALEGAAPEDAE